ncbi:hypothetical protein PPRY_a2277 [Pseudoalteromonas prydzensis ACAM 620]|nr:hypothetical protein [Pseudoalteromonas prydzensis ACAM 620]
MTFKIQKALLTPYHQILTALDAIKENDYSVKSISPYSLGISGKVFKEIEDLSQTLRKKSLLYKKQNLLSFALIQQLDSPIVILDGDMRIKDGNNALSLWLGKEWSLINLMPASHLQLLKTEQGWKFNATELNNNYSIRSGRYHDEFGEHTLLIFTDISKELRRMQKESWQQLVRVLSHEIKNSLTPIQSLAQLLERDSKDENDKEILSVIVDRSKNLNTFVAQYSKIFKPLTINRQQIDLKSFIQTQLSLNEPLSFELNLQVASVVADPVLLEQVFINLIVNAKQANDDQCHLTITSYLRSNQVVIEFTDSGTGIQNPENLFIPFYTTKPDGQGIGLPLCQNIIEQHGGQLTLTNRVNNQGAIASIRLPTTAELNHE